MFSVITVIHNQAKNLPKVLHSYENQSTQPMKYVFVLDRCEDNSEEILKNFSYKRNTVILKNKNGLDFQAGYCRDLGLKECEGNVLFLDGDCIPSKNLFEQFNDELSIEEPCITIAKRVDINEYGKADGVDSRETTHWFVGMVLTEEKNIITNKELARKRMITWSCCLGLNKKAINQIIGVNKHLGYSDRLFPSAFDGVWGGEDDHIGHVAMFMDIKIIALSTSHYVSHIWHPSRQNIRYEKTSIEMYNNLKKYAIEINAPGIKYSDIDIDQYVSSYMSKYKTHTNLNYINEPLDDEQ